MKRLVREIHRRSLWQVLGIYLAGSWIALQVVEIVTDSLGLPDWVRPFAILLLVLGLPIVLATAFVQEGIGTREADEATSTAASGSPVGTESASAGPAARSPAVAPEEAGREASAEAAASTGAATTAGHRRLLTWRNAIAGGVLAFALLGVVSGGYMAMRTLGIGPAASLVAAGVLDERAEIVLADFQTRTGDDELAGAATELLRVGLSQSRMIRLVQPARVRSVLQRMERPADTPLDPPLAREVAMREGLPAVIAGEINAAGPSYAITARVITAEGGEELVAYSETARDSAAVIDAVDELSKRLREKIGESLRTIRNEAPLESVTTADLEALELYSQAVHATEVEDDDDRAIALLEEAVGRDTAFAMAWRKLGVLLNNNQQERARTVEALTRAFEHRDRLTEAERYLAMASYYQWAVDDRDRAITAYENLLEVDPDSYAALNNLSLIYAQLEDWERTAALRVRAIAADSSLPLLYQNLAQAQVALGRLDDAERAVEAMGGRVAADDESFLRLQGAMQAVRGEYAAAEERFATLLEAHPANQRVRAGAHFALAGLSATRGRLSEAREQLALVTETQARRGLRPSALFASIVRAQVEALVLDDPDAAGRALDEALAEHPLETMDPLERPYIALAGAFARAGRPDRGQRLLEEYRSAVDPEFHDELGLHFATGEIALAEGRWEEAAEALRRSVEGRCPRRCPELARAHDLAGRADSALVLYDRYVRSPDLFGAVFQDPAYLAPFHERLGQLYDERGELEKAAEHYAKFTDLWAEADEALQPRVREAQARLEEIVRERG